MYLGHSAAMSMPAAIEFVTMHRAIALARKPIPAKKVPALAPGLNEWVWMARRSWKGFHRTSPYISAVADVTRSPQSAVMHIAIGAVTICPNRAALGVLAYLVQSVYLPVQWLLKPEAQYGISRINKSYRIGQGNQCRKLR